MNFRILMVLLFSVQGIVLFRPESSDLQWGEFRWGLFLEGISAGDFIALSGIVCYFRRNEKFLPWKEPTIVILVSLLAWMLASIMFKTFGRGGGWSEAYEGARWVVVLVSLGAIMGFSGKPATPLFFSSSLAVLVGFSLVLAWAGVVNVVQYLPGYKGYVDFLVMRFQGLSNNTNVLADSLFAATTIYYTTRTNVREQWRDGKGIVPEYTTALLLMGFCTNMKGRYAFLTLTAILLSWLHGKGRDRQVVSMAILGSVLFFLLLTLRLSVFPLQSEWPFLNTSSNMYAIEQDTYIRMNMVVPLMGWKKSEIREEYPKRVDLMELERSFKSWGMKDQGQAEQVKHAIGHFMDPHNILLEFWARYGIIAFILFVAVNMFLLIGYFQYFGLGIETQLLLLSSMRYLFAQMSRASWCLLFAQVMILVVVRRRQQSGDGSVTTQTISQTGQAGS